MAQKIYYITCIDSPSGIYQSQVVDVINFLNAQFDVNIQLVALIPWTNYSENKKKIISMLPGAIVKPLVLGVARWKKSKLMLNLVTSKNAVAITRGPIAFALAQNRFKKIIYDGRAAVKAEVEEYNVTGTEALGQQFIEAERSAVLNADYRIAVSNQLVKFWGEEYGYSKSDHVVIPSTLNNDLNNELIKCKNDGAVKVVYAGSTSEWQSFSLVVKMLDEAMSKQGNLEVLFLTREVPEIEVLAKKYSGRCIRKWVNHNQVYEELSNCDYGILLREKRVTNKVASPVKFAEYLNAGLSVIISPDIGDYSEFVEKNQCGVVVSGNIPELRNLSEDQRQKNRQLCSVHYLKSSSEIHQKYKSLIKSVLNSD